MKKIGYIICLVAILSILMSSCSSDKEMSNEPEEKAAKQSKESKDTKDTKEKKVLKIGTLKGPTGMGMSYLMEMAEKGQSKIDYSFNVVGAPDQLNSDIISNKVDIAAVPSNLAAILYAKTKGEVKLLGVNTLGVLYLVENGNEINKISDLKGKKIALSGKGAAPEYILNYLLSKNGLKAGEDVVVDYSSEHSEIATALVAGKTNIAILPEPFVTTVTSKNPKLKVALDFTKEWAKATSDTKLPMGVIVVTKKTADEKPDLVKTFMAEYQKSVDFVNKNHDQAGEYIQKYQIVQDAKLAAKAIPNSSITLIEAQKAQDDILAFYKILHGFNPQTIGGSIPDDKFFYK